MKSVKVLVKNDFVDKDTDTTIVAGTSYDVHDEERLQHLIDADVIHDPSKKIPTKKEESEDDDDKGLSLEDALAGLDNANDEHWEDNGQPSLKYLSEVTKSTVKRKAVNDLAKDLVRKKD